MNLLLRSIAGFAESMVYGLSYSGCQALIRSPAPLDEEEAWNLVTCEVPRTLEWLRRNYPPRFARRFLLHAKMKQDHLLGISAHYDVSNEFYELFLDKKYMFYSCADFDRGDETLEDAQAAKADFILKLIDPKPGEQILDLGCGWGAMLRRIHEATGDQAALHGYSLSKQQIDYIRANDGFDVELKNFITCEYRQHSFDKIYSIGAWEHVRHRDVPQLLAKLYSALKPGGRMVKHFFCPVTETVDTSAVVAQIFFPGSFQPAYPTQIRAFEQAGFRIVARSIHDYRPTLRAWFDNLVTNRERAIELVGVPTYNKYVVFFPASWRYFNDGDAILVRYVLEKPE